MAAAGGAASGCVTRASSFPSSEREVFPVVEPSLVDVDPQNLTRALTFIDAEVQGGSIPGAALVATRHGK